MGNIIKWLDGKKSYFIAALMGLNVFLHAIGKTDDNTFNMIQGVLLGGGIGALKAAIQKVA